MSVVESDLSFANETSLQQHFLAMEPFGGDSDDVSIWAPNVAFIYALERSVVDFQGFLCH